MTGSELMSGDTIDTNSAFLANLLFEAGLQTHEMVTVGDELNQLTHQLHRLVAKSDLVIMNGGLGPTQDDLTATVVADVAGSPVCTHEEARQHIQQWCKNRGITANAANLKQAELPEHCNIFPDAPGSAPAFYLTINDCLVIATPGVPSELKDIARKHLLPFVTNYFPSAKTRPWKKKQLIGIGESRLQELLDKQCAGINETLDIGFRARFPTLEFKYRPQHDIDESSPVYQHWEEKIIQLTKDYLLGDGDISAAELLIDTLKERNLSVTCAESCTGGLIASQLTRIPGSSAVFPGSIVSYANTVKNHLLGAPQDILDKHGAVSRETVSHMLRGVLDAIPADMGIAVSGIAGPNGGTEDKPVGTVWIAWGNQDHHQTVKLFMPVGRHMFQELVATISIDLLRHWARGNFTAPHYLTRWIS